MKLIELTYPEQLKKDELTDTVAAIGFFDGIHKGHQSVISEAIRIANNNKMESAVISFHPHPSVILNKTNKRVHYITTLKEKKYLLEQMGVDRLYMITFNKELSQLSPETFIEHFIIGLQIKHLVAGFDYTFGHKGAGNMNNIHDYSQNAFKTTVVQKLENEAEKVSSTRIRQLLQEGDVHLVKELLGRFYETTGTVVRGDNRGGRKLGFPTANLDISSDKLLPKQGVYAVKVFINEKVYNGMANLGLVPTFVEGRTEPKVEVYIFDFDEDIYGKQLKIEWYNYVREEKKFNGITEIVNQLEEDERVIRNYFA